MTYAPETIRDVQEYMKAVTGLPWRSLGIISEGHGDSYHRGKGYVGDGSYSVHESPRDEAGLTGAASAFDFGDFHVTYRGRATSLRTFSTWLVRECVAGAADTADIRSVIYTPDGKTVKRWDRLRKRATGDDSHLSHTHISWHRDAEHRRKVGLFRRYFEQEDTVTTIEPHQNLAIHSTSWVKDHPELKDRPTVQDGLHVDTCLVEGWAYGDLNHRALKRIEATLTEGIPVTLSDVQLDDLAERVVARLQGLRFVAQ